MASADRCIALFIDLENLVTHTGISSASFDLDLLLGPLEKKGRVVYRRAYADWSRFRDAALTLHDAGVELVEVPPSSRAGKNSADIRLVVDALEACYQHPHLDTFAIASGDSDFCPLASKLRENNRRVIGLAVKQAASPFLVNVCDEFIVIRGKGRSSEKAEKADPPEKKEPTANTRRVAVQTDLPLPSPPANPPRAPRGSPVSAAPIPEAVIEAVTALLAGTTAKVNPSAVKSAILRRDPAFTERKAGFSTFAKLLLALEKAGILRREQHGRQWYVLAPTPPPEADGNK